MKLFASIAVISHKMKKDHVSAFAAECSLFIIMCIFPLLVVLLTAIKYLPVSQQEFVDFINRICPEAFQQAFESLVNQVYTPNNTVVFIVTFISILWIAGKGVHSLIDGLNCVYSVDEKRGDFLIRLVSILYTIIFVVVFILAIGIFVLSDKLVNYIGNYAPRIAGAIESVMNLRFLFSAVIFAIIFDILYVALPSRHVKLRRQLPGALFAAIGWTGFTYFFSLYFKYSTNLTFVYGSLTNVACGMLWLYTVMYIFLMGAEINCYLEQWNSGKSVAKQEQKKSK